MAVVAFVGCINDEERDTPIIRNGKTCSMTGYGYLNFLNGCEVWSNYFTNFSSHVIGMQKMIDKLRNEKINKHIILLISEMGDLLDAIGSSQQEVLFINAFLRQLGKIGEDKGEVTLYYDVQRFNDIHLRMRIHTTNVLIPEKTHLDNSPCYMSKCKKEHKIYIYSYKPHRPKPIKCFNALRIGKQTGYDTYEIMKDTLLIPTKKEYAKMLQDEEIEKKELIKQNTGIVEAIKDGIIY